jgi:hypothetical protein
MSVSYHVVYVFVLCYVISFFLLLQFVSFHIVSGCFFVYVVLLPILLFTLSVIINYWDTW